MKGVEFYNSPSGAVIMQENGKQKIITQQDSDVIQDILDLIKDNFDGVYEALDICYQKSRPNIIYHRYQMASRFVRCNLGNFDTMKLDVDEDGSLNIEQVACPLRGTGDCPWENIICLPKKKVGNLAPRQIELVTLLAEGHSNIEIAGIMGITINTVHNIVQTIKTKLKIQHTRQIIAWYNTYHVR